jgi:hypothetical protein
MVVIACCSETASSARLKKRLKITVCAATVGSELGQV